MSDSPIRFHRNSDGKIIKGIEPTGVPEELDEEAGGPFRTWFPSGRPNPDTDEEAYKAWYERVVNQPRGTFKWVVDKKLTQEQFEQLYVNQS